MGESAMKKSKYKGRRCSQFYCSLVRDRRCCADCVLTKRKCCERACKNHPDKCGLVESPEENIDDKVEVGR